MGGVGHAGQAVEEGGGVSLRLADGITLVPGRCGVLRVVTWLIAGLLPRLALSLLASCTDKVQLARLVGHGLADVGALGRVELARGDPAQRDQRLPQEQEGKGMMRAPSETSSSPPRMPAPPCKKAAPSHRMPTHFGSPRSGTRQTGRLLLTMRALALRRRAVPVASSTVMSSVTTPTSLK